MAAAARSAARPARDRARLGGGLRGARHHGVPRGGLPVTADAQRASEHRHHHRAADSRQLLLALTSTPGNRRRGVRAYVHVFPPAAADLSAHRRRRSASVRGCKPRTGLRGNGPGSTTCRPAKSEGCRTNHELPTSGRAEHREPLPSPTRSELAKSRRFSSRNPWGIEQPIDHLVLPRPQLQRFRPGARRSGNEPFDGRDATSPTGLRQPRQIQAQR